MDVGQKLAEERLRRGITQKFVAEKLNRTPQWLFGIEKGRTKVKVDDLIAIAKVIDLDLGDFFNNNLKKQRD